MVNFILALIPSLFYSFAYTLGGRDEAPIFRPRIWRRIIAPLLLTSGVMTLALSANTYKWPMLLSVITYTAALSIQKYGGETLWAKVKGRVAAGIVMSLAALPIAICAGSWSLFICQIILAITAHLAFGLTSLLRAEYEELSISFLTVVLVPFMVL